MEPQQRPVEWITPFANAFTLEFCSMAVDNLLQLHVYLQERTAKGEIKKFHVVWQEWASYQTTLEECYIPAFSIAEEIFPCFTYKVSPSHWAAKQSEHYNSKSLYLHFVLGTESIAIEVLAPGEPVINEIVNEEEWAQVVPQKKSTILIRPLDNDEIDKALRQSDEPKS